MKVEVYRNPHKRCFSVRALEGPKKGKVLLHTDAVLLKDVEFLVQQSGKAQICRDRKDWAHAVVRGEIRAVSSFAANTLKGLVKSRNVRMSQFTYNPYDNDMFVDRHLRIPLTSSDWAVFGVNGNWYINEVDDSERLLSA